MVVSGGGDGTVRVWDAATGDLVGEPFTGHDDWVRSVAIGRLDGCTVVVSGSDDGTVRVWDAATSTPISDPPLRYDKAEIPPSKIDLAAWVFGIAYVAPSRLVIATELGIVSLRIPMSSLHLSSPTSKQP